MDRRFGGPLPRQLPNPTRAHPVPPEFFTPYHAVLCAYAVLAVISNCYPPVQGRLPTRYSPVRRSVKFPSSRRIPEKCFARLACVKHAASVHPEPGSNSHKKFFPGIELSLANSYPFYCFKVSSFESLYLLRTFKVVSLFSCQGSSLSPSFQHSFNKIT